MTLACVSVASALLKMCSFGKGPSMGLSCLAVACSYYLFSDGIQIGLRDGLVKTLVPVF